jgi:hypothetical protein
MSRALVKLTLRPPKELASFFADPPLVGDESREDYDSLFSALAAAAKPVDAIAWISALCARCSKQRLLFDAGLFHLLRSITTAR